MPTILAGNYLGSLFTITHPHLGACPHRLLPTCGRAKPAMPVLLYLTQLRAAHLAFTRSRYAPTPLQKRDQAEAT